MAKLAEAEYFYGRMQAERYSDAAFLHNLSAFLAAARSVLQYALKEAKAKSGGTQWYTTRVSGTPVLKFFKGKRDLTIHEKPVVPAKEVNLEMHATLRLSSSLELKVFDSDGNLRETRVTPPEPPPTSKAAAPATVTVEYTRFADWLGTEDLMTLCKLYMDELKAVVADGQAQGFVTG